MPAPRPALCCAAWLGAGLAFAVTGPTPVLAQETTAPPATGTVVPKAPILSVDEEKLFTDTRFGQAVLSRHRAEMEKLLAENRRIEAALEAEERDLTERRAILPAAEFQTLAADFDRKAEGIRAAQSAKDKALQARLESERQRFFQAAVPILAQILQESGAMAIIDKRAVILSFDRIDMTAAAATRIDAVLGDGGIPPDGTAPAQPESPSEGDAP